MLFKFKILLLFLSFVFYACALKPFRQEVLWAIWHPVAALKVKKINALARVVYNQPDVKTALDNLNNGGKLDAFRHTFFMAAFAQKIKVKKLRKLGIAHEKGNYHQFLNHKNEEGEISDSQSNAMDLSNNELGFIIGHENKKLNLEDLKLLVIKEINAGKALVMKRSAQGLYVDCENNVIDLKKYSGRWLVPKCLVPSN